MKLYVITGGPGVGKTALIEALRLAGYETVEEDARAIIKDELSHGGDALPWRNKPKYALRMLHAGVQRYQEVLTKGKGQAIFFDRSVIDALCYVLMENITVEPRHLARAQECVYEKNVFILPPWMEIYETDAERKQSWPEALRTFDWLKKAYSDLGYKLIDVPRMTVDQRCAFVLDCLDH